MNKIVKYIVTVFFFGTFIACSDVLDKDNLNAVSDQAVWENAVYATAFLDKLHRDNVPGWDSRISQDCDEAVSNERRTYPHGELDINGISTWPYEQIRNCNTLIENVESGSLDPVTVGRLKGQALVIRAWLYFDLVRQYGGVPMIMNTQTTTDDLYVSRNKASECFTLIVKDLDDAIAIESFPMKWEGSDAGRISKAAAVALKGRVLLYQASPQFNPNNDQVRWQAAYDANKTAREALSAAGYGLFDNFETLWYKDNEMNKEAVFVKRHSANLPQGWSAPTRPPASLGDNDANRPSWELVSSFPMKDGKAVGDPESVYAYNDARFWENRDPRLAASVVWNGSVWELYGESGHIQWTWEGGPNTAYMYCRKAVDPALSLLESHISNCGTDWIEIRYAEVLLNMAECAAALNKADDVYALIGEIRQRAGIDAGAGSRYGLKAGMSANELTDAVRSERKIE
ncbi:MAG: RagB/SusD family nutrient uptake outer membrane protein, partial [Tannerella sp.]|nr:RagB/SusD family nutrient uptake outer membrane protein [Tannerella sp.]